MSVIDDLPLATDAELETLPPGLYVACGEDGVPLERDHESDVYDALADRFMSGPMILLARVRAFGLIPSGVESVTIRHDGFQIIKQWVLNRGA